LGWSGADCGVEVPREEINSDAKSNDATSNDAKNNDAKNNDAKNNDAKSKSKASEPESEPIEKQKANSDQSDPKNDTTGALAALEASQRVSTVDRREVRIGLSSNSELEDIPNVVEVPSVTPTATDTTVAQTTHRLRCDPPCSSRGYCVALGGAPQCFCQDGYTGVACEKASRQQIPVNKHQTHS